MNRDSRWNWIKKNVRIDAKSADKKKHNPNTQCEWKNKKKQLTTFWYFVCCTMVVFIAFIQLVIRWFSWSCLLLRFDNTLCTFSFNCCLSILCLMLWQDANAHTRMPHTFIQKKIIILFIFIWLKCNSKDVLFQMVSFVRWKCYFSSAYWALDAMFVQILVCTV